MNRTALVLALVVIGLLTYGLFFHTQPAVGQGEKKDDAKPEKRVLTTGGSATIRVKPDAARLFLTIETTAPTVKEARARNNEHAKKVMDTVQALRIPDLKMRSTNMEMTIVHSRDDKKVEELPRVLGYKVSNSFTVLVTSDDPVKLASHASKVLDTAIENGANVLDRISFFKVEMAETRRLALTKATEDAIANARSLASGAGRTITDVTTIDGNPIYMERDSNSNTVQPQAIIVSEGGTPLAAGLVEVNCRVSVTCTYGAGK